MLETIILCFILFNHITLVKKPSKNPVLEYEHERFIQHVNVHDAYVRNGK